jgi:RNA polymerase sigma-70 factor (ECF subfamily)
VNPPAGGPAGGAPGDDREALAVAFTEQRPRLVSLAYRLTGSVADAQDVAQEAWIRLQRAAADEGSAPRDLAAWLTTTTTRLALDLLRATGRRKETYVGPWLPEPVVAPAGRGLQAAPADPADVAALADELSFAMMVVLESLSPAQRAAFILHDTFGVPFDEVAAALGRTPAAVRQLASRAREQVAAGTPRERADPATHRRVLEAFVAASAGGDLQELVAALDPSVVYRADGGGVVRAALNPVHGADRVARLVLGLVGRNVDADFAVGPVNGQPGLLVGREGRVIAVVALDVTAQGRIAAVNAMFNPEKLGGLRMPVG